MSEGLTFKGGIHPLREIHHGKSFTEQCQTVEMPAPKIVRIPLSQHIGAPATPLVQPGDTVKMGQKIGEAAGFVSVPCHASVSGKVLAIENVPSIMGKMIPAVVIENDFLDTKEEYAPVDLKTADAKELISVIADAGIVGMGGATFPLHVKLSPPPDKNINMLIINGAECEPFLTSDHRLMLEQPKQVIAGTKVLLAALGVSKAFIGIEDNKQNAIATLQNAIDTHAVRVVELKTKYPQGSEKQIIEAISGRVVPSGALPAEAGVVVANVASAKAVADRVFAGEPLIRRIVTVTGSVGKPQNLLVRIGTSFAEVLEAAGGMKEDIRKIVSGGPMMGLPVPSLDCVVTKGTSGLLVLGEEFFPQKEVLTACIRCGKCAAACPMHLMPMDLAACGEKELFERAESLNVTDCINCGSCSYVCPAKRNVSQFIKLAKDQVLAKRAKERAKQK